MKEIDNLLRRLGIGSNYYGFQITAAAVELVLKDLDRLLFVTKELYPDVAEKCNCSVYSVERNIRTVARVAWNRNPELLISLAQYPMSVPPSASQFIDILAAHLARNAGGKRKAAKG
ncbi:MAG: hypothetical protein E7456_02895 [Ruminococcaceae bacterium]|nr:hypothetical protein [Oscillospiraceae bacterium]